MTSTPEKESDELERSYVVDLRERLDSMGGHTAYVKDRIFHVHTLDKVLNDQLVKATLGIRLWN
jgi:hypothetical protein